MLLWNFLRLLLMPWADPILTPAMAMAGEGGDGGGGSGSGGDGSGSGTGGQGQGGDGGGTIMSGGGAGAGDQGGDKGAGSAGGDGGGSGGDDDKAWNWADGITGAGERPPWFKADKYKTVDAQARAAIELEQKIGPAAELIGAPEGDYAIPAPPEGVAGELDPDDPLLKGFQSVAKELGLSQKAHDTIVGSIAKTIADQNAADEQATADALAALGNNVDARVSQVQQVLTAQFGEDAFKALDAAIGNDVPAFQALEKLVAKVAGDAQLAGEGAGSGPAFSKADVEAEQYKVFPEGHHLAGKRMYEHDKEHRAKVDTMWKQLYPGEDRQQVG